jgi:hypothetical protein
VQSLLRPNRILAAAPLNVWQVPKRATSRDMASFPGRRGCGLRNSLFQVLGRGQLTALHAECNAPPGFWYGALPIRNRISFPAFPARSNGQLLTAYCLPLTVIVGNGRHPAVVAHACAHPPGLTTSLRSPTLGANATGTGPNHLRTSAVSTGNIHVHVTQRLAHSLRMRMGVAIARRDR